MDGELRLGIEERYVGHRTEGERAPRHAEEAGRRRRVELDQPREGEKSGPHQTVVAQTQVRLEPDDAERRQRELDAFSSG